MNLFRPRIDKRRWTRPRWYMGWRLGPQQQTTTTSTAAGPESYNPGNGYARTMQNEVRVSLSINSHSTRPKTSGHSGLSGWNQVGFVSVRARLIGLMLPGLKLLGFKDRSELQFEDNIKHSLFIYPDELVICSC